MFLAIAWKLKFENFRDIQLCLCGTSRYSSEIVETLITVWRAAKVIVLYCKISVQKQNKQTGFFFKLMPVESSSNIFRCYTSKSEILLLLKKISLMGIFERTIFKVSEQGTKWTTLWTFSPKWTTLKTWFTLCIGA